MDFLNLSFLKFTFILLFVLSVADHNKVSFFQLSTNIRDLILLKKNRKKRAIVRLKSNLEILSLTKKYHSEKSWIPGLPIH